MEFKIPKVERHHIWFAITSIIVVLLMEFGFVRFGIKGPNAPYLAYILFLFMGTKPLVFALYSTIFYFFDLKESQKRKLLGIGDIDLTVSVVITSFLLKDALEIWGISVVFLVPVVFSIVYLLNKGWIPPHD